jgi:DNA mismatch endonuclease (patch repair protein)
MEQLLAASGLEYEMYPKIFGNPDFLVGPRMAVFCDSSFWHGRNWRSLRQKLSRSHHPEYWINHILSNRRRDRIVSARLRKLGYNVIRFWDDDILKRPHECIELLRKTMRLS